MKKSHVTIKFKCPKCNKSYSIEEKYAGRSAKCSCGTRLSKPSRPQLAEEHDAKCCSLEMSAKSSNNLYSQEIQVPISDLQPILERFRKEDRINTSLRRVAKRSVGIVVTTTLMTMHLIILLTVVRDYIFVSETTGNSEHEILVMDMNVPGMNKIEDMIQLKKENPGLRDVILLINGKKQPQWFNRGYFIFLEVYTLASTRAFVLYIVSILLYPRLARATCKVWFILFIIHIFWACIVFYGSIRTLLGIRKGTLIGLAVVFPCLTVSFFVSSCIWWVLDWSARALAHHNKS